MAIQVQPCVRSERNVRRAAAPLALALLLAFAHSASAFDFFDGRLQVHGYGEMQFRSVAKNYSWADDFDLTQWQYILGVEADINFAPDGIGPFDLISGFVRLEARYDCVWTRGCGVFPSVNAWGNRSEHLPNRNSNAKKSGYTGAIDTGDHRRIESIKVTDLGFEDLNVPVSEKRKPAFLWHVPGVDTLFGVKDPLQTDQLSDDPAFYVFNRFVEPGHEYRFGLRKYRGQQNGNSLQVLGPWEPQNTIEPLGSLANIANPFNPQDINPVLVPSATTPAAAAGSAAMPYRPSPLYQAGLRAPDGQGDAARGLFIPNEAVAKKIREHAFDSFDQNYSEAELMWNRGASQDEKEFKEGYIDFELLDSRLWIRGGKQNIVWGKTELFRTTDQFNPVDLALATLPSLEESRIALWALRGVYSLYSVGPLEDVRAEFAINLDQMEPTDLGRCGEPYTPLPVCDKSAALFGHGIAGSTLAGEERPPNWWDNSSGVELGGRVEFRWDRFSFAVSDFWGYDDFPFVEQIFLYERNVDPRTGRPRMAGSTAGCDPDGTYGGDTSGCLTPEDALTKHHANQQRFALICASSIGFSNLDRSACAQSVFNSNKNALTGVPDSSPSIPEVLGTVFSGSTVGRNLVLAVFIPGTGSFPIVRLNADASDGPGQGVFAASSISAVTTVQQQALLGCGTYWGTSCDTSTSTAFGGVDLLNAELSVLMQSWPGFPGTEGAWNAGAGPTGPIQPGTIRNCGANPGAAGCNGQTGLVPFTGGAVASRAEFHTRYTLPGAHSPFVEATALRQGPIDWSANIDGCVRASDAGCAASNGGAGAFDLLHPYSGDYFMSEMAAFSWNYLEVLISFSRNDKTGASPEHPCATGENTNDCRQINEFIANPVYSLRTDGCSFYAPQFCSNVQALFSVAHTTRKDVKAGGNGDFGRTDFDWHQGGSGVLRYEKRNVFGISADFAEDATKSNWGIESTWIEGNQFEDRDQFDSLTQADTYNLTVSVDRPTFINFLNPGRTFFFNSQWFFQYVAGYRDSFVTTGPLNVLATFHVDTGYFRDRLLPGITFVYDFNTASGAILPEIQYRFTENLSATLTANLFSGRFNRATPAVRTIADYPFRAGRHQNTDWTEQGLSPVRDMDEVALRVRYTF